jgi:hypothetical protein
VLEHPGRTVWLPTRGRDRRTDNSELLKRALMRAEVARHVQRHRANVPEPSALVLLATVLCGSQTLRARNPFGSDPRPPRGTSALGGAPRARYR